MKYIIFLIKNYFPYLISIIQAWKRIILNFIVIPRFGGNGAAMTTLVSESYVAIYFYYLVKKDKKTFINKHVLMVSVFGGIIVGGISVTMRELIKNSALHIILAGILSMGGYALVQLIGKNPVVFDLLPIRWKKKDG